MNFFKVVNPKSPTYTFKELKLYEEKKGKYGWAASFIGENPHVCFTDQYGKEKFKMFYMSKLVEQTANCCVLPSKGGLKRL